MSIQKQKLETLANSLHKSIRTLFEIGEQKKSFAAKINYRIAQLFALISDYPTISSRELLAMFDGSSIKLLIQNKKYLTAKDICAYLGISDKHASGTLTKAPPSKLSRQKDIEVDTRYEFEDIMNKQIDVMENIREALKLVPPDLLFNQIDFFNNGYVDASSFSQFVRHYAKNSQAVQTSQRNKNENKNQNMAENNKNKTIFEIMQLEFLNVVRYLKGSATAQKIFYADFVPILEETIAVQNNPQQHQNPINYSHTLSRQVGHIAKVSDIELLHSRSRRGRHQIWQDDKRNMNESNMNNISHSRILKLDTDQNQGSGQLNGKLNHEDIERINRIMTHNSQEIPYEQKICSNHWRNAKYLQKLKLQMNVTKLKSKPAHYMRTCIETNVKDRRIEGDVHIRKAHQKFNHSFAPFQYGQQIENVNSSQIIYQFRYLSQIYEKYRKEVESLIIENKHFSFLNGFNVIDIKDKGYITYRQLKEFLFETQIVIHQNKVRAFFNALSSQLDQNPPQQSQSEQKHQNADQKVIFYHRFVAKIFKLKCMQSVYGDCRKRKPLVAQQWPEYQQANFCKFIRAIICIFHQITVAKQSLLKMLKINQKQSDEKKDDEKIIKSLSDKMEIVFKQTDMHRDKLREIIGKKSQALIGELFKQQIILQPAMLVNFLMQVV